MVGYVLSTDAGEGVEDRGDGVAGGGEVTVEFHELFGCLVVGGAIGFAGWAPFAIRLRRQVQVEDGGVQFAAEDEAALLVPAERWALPAAVASEFTKVLSCVEEFEDSRHHESENGLGVGVRWGHRDLIHREERYVDSADLLTGDEVKDERVEGAQQGGR